MDEEIIPESFFSTGDLECKLPPLLLALENTSLTLNKMKFELKIGIDLCALFNPTALINAKIAELESEITSTVADYTDKLNNALGGPLDRYNQEMNALKGMAQNCLIDQAGPLIKSLGASVLPPDTAGQEFPDLSDSAIRNMYRSISDFPSTYLNTIVDCLLAWVKKQIKKITDALCEFVNGLLGDSMSQYGLESLFDLINKIEGFLNCLSRLGGPDEYRNRYQAAMESMPVLDPPFDINNVFPGNKPPRYDIDREAIIREAAQEINDGGGEMTEENIQNYINAHKAVTDAMDYARSITSDKFKTYRTKSKSNVLCPKT